MSQIPDGLAPSGYGPPAVPSDSPPAISGYPGYVAPQPINQLAIVSLVSSIVWMCGLGALAGIITGGIAIGQISRTTGRGLGLAIAGLGIGVLGLLGSIPMWFGFSRDLTEGFVEGFTSTYRGGADRSDVGTGPTSDTAAGSDSDTGSDTSGTLPSFWLPQDLASGLCLDVYPETYDMSDATPIDCAEPHGLEVLYTFELAAPVAGSSDETNVSALQSCQATIVSQVTQTQWAQVSGDVYFPSVTQWNNGDRTAYCVLVPYTDGTQLSGSLVTDTYQGAVFSSTNQGVVF